MIEKVLMVCFLEIFTIAGSLYFAKKELDKKDKIIEMQKKELQELQEEKCKINIIRLKKLK